MMKLTKEMKMRILMTVLGVSICGISVGFFSYSDLGLDPFQVLAHGLWNFTPLDFGTFYVIVNVIMLVGVFIFNKRKIGLGTLINLTLIGYLAEFSEKLLRNAEPEPGFMLRMAALLFAIVVMCLASALYFTADLGVSTYDAVAITIDERTSDKLPFRYIRIATDLICVIAGGLMGGVFGIGTIITAFFMGPLIDFFKRTVSEPMLKKARED